MAESGPVYIITTGGGKLLTNTQDAHGVLDCIPKGTEQQKWIIESGEEPNVIAIKNCVGGQYLRNNGPLHVPSGAKIGLGEKQWWTMEKGRTPHSTMIRSNVCTAALPSYLNDFEGVYRDNNYVHMWQLKGWEHVQWWLDWYIVDAQDTEFKPLQAIGVGNGGKTEAENAREKELADREEGIKEAEEKAKQAEEQAKQADEKAKQADEKAKQADERAKSLDDRDATLKKREEVLAKKEKAAADKPAQLSAPSAPQSSKSNDEADKRAEALGKREAALKAREEQLAEQEKAAATKPTPTASAAPQSSKSSEEADKRAKALDQRDAALEKQARKLAEQEADLKRRASQLSPAQPKAAQQQRSFTPAKPSVDKEELERLKREIEMLQLWRENDRLKAQLKTGDLEDQLRKAHSSSSLGGKETKMSCGHKAYPPPRKIERKITGIMYEGLEGPDSKSNAGKACKIAGHHHK